VSDWDLNGKVGVCLVAYKIVEANWLWFSLKVVQLLLRTVQLVFC